MCCRVFRTSVQNLGAIATFENCIKVNAISMQQSCSIYRVLKMPIYFHQILYFASLKVENNFGRFITKLIPFSHSVDERLLKFFVNCFLVETSNINAVKVIIFPKISFLKLLIYQSLIIKRYYEEISRRWKHSTSLVQKFIPGNNKCFNHSFIE